MINVYIQPESSCEVDHEAVCIGDVADVYCRDEALQKRLEALVFMELKPDDETRYVISAMALVACIDRQAGQPVTVCNIGAGELILARSRPKQHFGAAAARIVMVTMITFFGSIFAIMTYNEDVDVNGVFDRLYTVLTGSERMAPGILEAAYAAGVAVGIILFFNHFGRRRQRKEPTPMEIEMEKFETDMDNTWMKEASRTGAVIVRSPAAEKNAEGPGSAPREADEGPGSAPPQEAHKSRGSAAPQEAHEGPGSGRRS